MAERTNNKWIHTFSNVLLPCYSNSYAPVAFVHKPSACRSNSYFLNFLNWNSLTPRIFHCNPDRNPCSTGKLQICTWHFSLTFALFLLLNSQNICSKPGSDWKRGCRNKQLCSTFSSSGESKHLNNSPLKLPCSWKWQFWTKICVAPE